jgi:hypothetical protein
VSWAAEKRYSLKVGWGSAGGFSIRWPARMRRTTATDAHSRTKKETIEIRKRICIRQQKNTKARRFVPVIRPPETIAWKFDGCALLPGLIFSGRRATVQTWYMGERSGFST